MPSASHVCLKKNGKIYYEKLRLFVARVEGPEGATNGSLDGAAGGRFGRVVGRVGRAGRRDRLHALTKLLRHHAAHATQVLFFVLERRVEGADHRVVADVAA